MRLYHPALLLIFLCLGVVLASCHSSVRFQPHAPYNAPRRFAAPLIIVHPDGINELRADANVGTPFRPRKFRVYYGQALITETVARFGNMFTGVFLISESDFEKLRTTDPDAEEKDEMDLYSLPPSLVGERGYVLHMRRVRFEFDAGRALYMVDASFTNRETGAELFRAVVRGRGVAITARQDTNFMIEELKKAVTSSNTSLLNPMVERLRRAIEEEPPPPDVPEEVPAANETSTEEAVAEEEQVPAQPAHPRLRPFFVTPE